MDTKSKRNSFFYSLIISTLMLAIFTINLIARGDQRIQKANKFMNEIENELKSKSINITIKHDSLKSKLDAIKDTLKTNYLDYIDDVNDRFNNFIVASIAKDKYKIDKKRWELNIKYFLAGEDSVFVGLCIDYFNKNLNVYSQSILRCKYNNGLLNDEIKRYRDPSTKQSAMKTLFSQPL